MHELGSQLQGTHAAMHPLDTLLHVGFREGSPLKEVQNAATNSDTLSTNRAAASC